MYVRWPIVSGEGQNCLIIISYEIWENQWNKEFGIIESIGCIATNIANFLYKE